MPRWPRQWRPGAYQHVISRFLDRRYRFADDDDRKHYLFQMERLMDRWDARVLSYSLMSSHVHLGALAGMVPPVRFFGPLHTRYARHWHSRHGGLGPVFAERPTNFEVEGSRLARLVAYHHRNPVEAGAVGRPLDSRWTSHRIYMRVDPAPPWLDVEWALSLLGFADTAAGRAHFDAFVREVDLNELPTVARGADERRHIATGWRASAGERRQVPSAGDWAVLRQITATYVAVPEAELLTSRTHRASAARRLLAAFAREVLGAPLVAIAHCLGISESGVHHLLFRHTGPSDHIDAQVRELRLLWEGGRGRGVQTAGKV